VSSSVTAYSGQDVALPKTRKTVGRRISSSGAMSSMREKGEKERVTVSLRPLKRTSLSAWISSPSKVVDKKRVKSVIDASLRRGSGIGNCSASRMARSLA